jgi:hypothetical protein
MICPHCNTEIDDKLLSQHLGGKGGRKSRRVLSPEEAKRIAKCKKEVV